MITEIVDFSSKNYLQQCKKRIAIVHRYKTDYFLQNTAIRSPSQLFEDDDDFRRRRQNFSPSISTG